jgi:Domain of unknown function (DUF1508)
MNWCAIRRRRAVLAVFLFYRHARRRATGVSQRDLSLDAQWRRKNAKAWPVTCSWRPSCSAACRQLWVHETFWGRADEQCREAIRPNASAESGIESVKKNAAGAAVEGRRLTGVRVFGVLHMNGLGPSKLFAAETLQVTQSHLRDRAAMSQTSHQSIEVTIPMEPMRWATDPV